MVDFPLPVMLVSGRGVFLVWNVTFHIASGGSPKGFWNLWMDDTVDGRNPANHLRCTKPCK